MLLDLLGSRQHLIHRCLSEEALNLWSHYFNCLIPSTRASFRGELLRTLLRNRREDAVKVTI